MWKYLLMFMVKMPIGYPTNYDGKIYFFAFTRLDLFFANFQELPFFYPITLQKLEQINCWRVRQNLGLGNKDYKKSAGVFQIPVITKQIPSTKIHTIKVPGTILDPILSLLINSRPDREFRNFLVVKPEIYAKNLCMFCCKN